MPQSVNKGTPVVTDAPRTAVARAFEGLADMFSTTEEAKRKKR